MRPPPQDDKGQLGARLSQIEGCAVTPQEPMASHTTLRIGGPVEFLVRVLTEEALAKIVSVSSRWGKPWRILGLGSNMLIPDAGLPGVVALLAGEFLEYQFRGSSVEAGAGLPLARLARIAVDQGFGGLEALAGFPSTVGGAVIMNAGCYGVEIKDLLETAIVVYPDGRRQALTAEDLQAGYRSTCLQGTDAVVVRATFRLEADDPANTQARLTDLTRRRRESMPQGRPNAGSIFKNPAGDHAGRLIDSCGLKGARRGGALISPEHANVIVNTGGARAEDVLQLMHLMHQSVVSRFGVSLEPEIVLTGDLTSRWKAMTED